MSIKVYQEKPESGDLYLRLCAASDAAVLSLVTEQGAVLENVASITSEGINLYGCALTADEIARAGLTNALDANGRLKVIGQEVEAEKCSEGRFQCKVTPNDVLHVWGTGGGDLEFNAHDDGHTASVKLNPATIRRLRDTLSAHLAYLEQEGLA